MELAATQLTSNATAAAGDIGEAYRGMALLVPSERVAQRAAELGFRSVVTAANAGTAATLTTLREIAKRKLLQREHQ